MKTQQVFAIQFRRLPKVDETQGLILLTVDTSNGAEAPRRIGTLTDVALRGRLAHYDLHSANEVAAIRKALGRDHGHVTVYEGWSGLGSCLQFWHSFIGSQIRNVEWTCERCAAANHENVGGNIGESFLHACKCGKVKQITVSAQLPSFSKTA